MFKPEDYGIDRLCERAGHQACQVALVGDTEELHAAHEYIEMVARQEHINARAFRTETAALRWLRGAIGPVPPLHGFTRIVIAGAPDEQGIYALWDGEEAIYSRPRPRIRSRLMDHYYGKVDEHTQRATHYGWELCKDRAAREAELLRRAPAHIRTSAAA